MSDALIAGSILGAILVPLVSLLKKEHWPTQVNFLVSLLLSFVAGLVITLVDNHVNSLQGVLALYGTIFTEMQVIYKLYFVGSLTDVALTAIGSNVVDVGQVANVTKTVSTTVQNAGSSTTTVVTGEASAVTQATG